VVPYLELLIKNGLVKRAEGKIVRYSITTRGEEALGHLCELEKMIVETGEEVVA
jgi:predicted transcriptional regulator